MFLQSRVIRPLGWIPTGESHKELIRVKIYSLIAGVGNLLSAQGHWDIYHIRRPYKIITLKITCCLVKY